MITFYNLIFQPQDVAWGFFQMLLTLHPPEYSELKEVSSSAPVEEPSWSLSLLFLNRFGRLGPLESYKKREGSFYCAFRFSLLDEIWLNKQHLLHYQNYKTIITLGPHSVSQIRPPQPRLKRGESNNVCVTASLDCQCVFVMSSTYAITHIATFANVGVRQALLSAVDEVHPLASAINCQQVILHIVL